MNKFKKLLVILMTITITVNFSSVTSFAVENNIPTDSDEIAEDLSEEDETVLVDEFMKETLEDEDVNLAEDELLEDELLEDETATVEDNELSEEFYELVEEEYETDYFYRTLNYEEINDKKLLSRDVASIKSATEGVDYASDEVYTVCDSIEEAYEIAEAYEAATGYTVTVESFGYRVAVLGLSGNKKASETNPRMKAMSRVEYMMSFAEDMDNNLPAVHVNSEKHICSAANYEHFEDPFLNVNNKPYYQVQHEPINDKYAWTKMVEKDNSPLLNDVVVAVIDTGVSTTHSDINLDADSFSTLIKKNTKTGDWVLVEGEGDIEDHNGHGTNVSGIIGAKANAIGGRGVAPGVKILGVKALGASGGATEVSVLRALYGVIEQIDTYHKNIVAVNMSLGGAIYDSAEEEAVNELIDRGACVVVAAGNENTQSLTYPAGFSNVICVAALKSDYTKASFSNYGNHVDIAAPGGHHGVGKEELLSTGISNVQDHSKYGSGSFLFDGEYYCSMAGTSQATPVVSGAVALLYAYSGLNNPYIIADRLYSTAIPAKASGVGAGCVDVRAALGIPSPSLDVNVFDSGNNKIVDKSEIGFSGSLKFSLEDKDYTKDATFYYTLNGKVPNPDNMASTGTLVTKGTFSVSSVNAAKVTIKVMPVLYGTKGNVCTINLNNSDLLVNDIAISSKVQPDSTGKYYVATGKTIQLTATALPIFAKNKKLVWESSDTSIATVSASGQVKGVSKGAVNITVKSTDSDDPCKKIIPVEVNSLTKQINVVEKDGKTPLAELRLVEPNTYKIDNGDIKTYPDSVSRSFAFKSSNVKVATVDETGLITAVGSGFADITISATDGSGVKDTLRVYVSTDVRTIELTTDKPYDELSEGQIMKFKPVFNGGQSVPDDIQLSWSAKLLNPGTASYSFDEKTATLKLIKVSEEEPATVTVTVKCPNGKTDSKDIKLYAKTTLLDYDYGYNSGYGYYPIKDIVFYNPFGQFSLVEGDSSEEDEYNYFIEPRNANPRVTFTSSNPKVVTVDENGLCTVVGKGDSKITVKTTDGSNKSIVFNFSSLIYDELDGNALGLKSKNDVEVFYPGKKVTYDVISNASNWNKYFDDYNKKYYGFFVGLAEEEDCNYIDIKGRTVSANNGTKNVPKDYETTIGLVWKNQIVQVVPIEIYPNAVTSIDLQGKDSVVLGIGDTTRLEPKALPSNSCQKHMTYTTSNSKIAKVYTDGTIEGVGNGTATITVTAGDGSGKKATCKVTVAQPVTSISIAPKTGTSNLVGAGAKLSLVATTNVDANNKAVTWKLKNNSDSVYAKVDASGNVIAEKNITASKNVVVVATAKDNSGVTGEFTVKVIPAITQVVASTPSVTLHTIKIGALNKSKDVSIAALSNGVNVTSAENIEVVSSNPSIATATYIPENKSVRIDAKSVGKTTVKVASTDGNKKSASIAVTVNKPVTSVEVSNAKGYTSVAIGKNIAMTAKTNSDASDKKVEWSLDTSNLTSVGVNNASLVKISSSGSVTVDKTFKYTGSERGYVLVRAMALDGSEVYDEKKIDINDALTNKIEVYNNGNLIDSKNKITLCTGSDAGSLKNNYKINVKNYYVGKSDAEVCKDFTFVSSNTSILRVVKSGTEDDTVIVSGYNPGTASVTITSSDGAAKAVVNFVVINPVKKLKASAKKDEFYVVAGSTFDVEAVTNENATNKKVGWSISGTSAANITQAGKISVNKDATVGTKFRAMASALDGSEETAYTSYFTVVSSYTNIESTVTEGGRDIKPTGCTISKGQTVTIDFYPDKEGACGEYKAYYVKTNGFVQYVESASGTPASKTTIKVTGINKGTIPITIQATDNSGKTKTYTVTVK